MHRFARTHQISSTSGLASRMRAKPAIHLCTGDMVGAFIEVAIDFDDRPMSLAQPRSNASSVKPAQWLADRIGDVASLCEITAMTERPIILPIPVACLTDSTTLDACIHAVAQTKLCHQELSLEITDSAFATHDLSARKLIQEFRQRGFRVSIDARKSWTASLSADCWLMIDTLRLRAEHIADEVDLMHRVELAAHAGVAIVAEHPKWRDGEDLAALGIDYGLSPKADA